MPRSTREWAQRKLREVQANMDWAIYHLGEVAEVYDKPHPEISEPLVTAANVLIELKEAVEGVRDGF